jgi:Zn finger protein HypA/HybF involved in hydrogenase expression
VASQPGSEDHSVMIQTRKIVAIRCSCQCERCAHQFVRIEESINDLPMYCPKCKSPYWKVPKGTLPVGVHKRKKAE